MYFYQSNALLRGEYINYAPNGYPIVIATLSHFIKASLLDDTLLWINIIVGTLTIGLLYKIGSLIFKKPKIALIASLLLALYPNQLNYTRWILTEIPCTFFLVAGYYLYIKNNNFLSGIVVGIASLFRTPVIIVGILISGYNFFIHRKVSLKLLGGLSIPLICIGSYCFLCTGKFAITGNETVNVVYAIASYTKATNGEIDWNAPKRHPEIKNSSQAWKAYLTHACKYPLEFVKTRLNSFWELWGFYPSSLGGTRTVASRLLIGVCNLFLFVGCLWCLWKNYKKKWIYLFLIPICSLSSIYILLVSMARYTVPMEPFMIILTSWSIADLTDLYPHRNRKLSV